MSKDKLVLHSREIDKFLKGPEMQKELGARVRRAAAAAGPGYKGEVNVGHSRALGIVVPATAEAEARNSREHTLMRSIDHLRG